MRRFIRNCFLFPFVLVFIYVTMAGILLPLGVALAVTFNHPLPPFDYPSDLLLRALIALGLVAISGAWTQLFFKIAGPFASWVARTAVKD